MADRNPYDDLIQQDTAQRLRASMSGVVDRQPDAEARLQTLARDYNMPVEAVRMRQPEIERTARLDAFDYDTLARQYPKTAGALTDPNQASIAHDDVDNMSTLERIGGGLKATAKYIFSAPDTKNTLAGDIGAGVFMASRGYAGAFRAATENTAPALDFLEGTPVGNPLRRATGFFDRSARDAGAIEARLSPPTNDIVQGGVSGGVKSLVNNVLALPLLFLPGGQAAYMTAVTSGAGGQSYQKAREKGVDPTTALIYGASDAVIEYGTEKIPVARLLGDLRAGAPLMQTLLRNAALEVPGEQVATVLQDLNEWAVLNPDKPFSTYLEERPAAAAQTLIATLVGVGGSVSVGTAIQKAVDNAAGVERDATRAEAHAKVLGELVTLAEASKVRERDPASFATFMQSLTEEGVPNVYVDAKALLQAVDINEVAMALPSVAEQIEQAAATGGDVVIPTAELLTAGPGQKFMQTLVDNARTAPDAMSPVEAREYMQAKGDQLAADIQTALSQQEQDQSWRQMRDDLRDEFKAQLDGVKRFTADVNLQYANLLANFYAVTAAKLGQTPQELATRYGLRVQSRGVEGGQVLDQGADFLLDDGAEPTQETDPGTGLPLNADGTVTVYHHTSAANAEAIRKGGVLRSNGEPDLYFTTTAETNTGYGDTAIPIRVKPERLQLDDEFPDGRQDFRVGAPSKLRRVKFLPNGAGVLQQSAPLPDTIEIDGKQRPTTNSNGQPIAQTEEGVRNFWKWFGDSKVVDDQGRPLVVYHGTAKSFTEFADRFDPEHLNTLGQNFGRPDFWHYFTPDTQEAALFATHADSKNFYLYSDKNASRANIIPVYVALRDPLIIRPTPEWTESQGGNGMSYMDMHRAEVRAQYVDAATHDGIIALHDDGSPAVFATEYGSLIKSATGNNGEFDPANPSILRQEARGSINLPDDLTRSPAILSLFAGADLSTFIHESGHFFLEVQLDLAARIQAEIDAGAQVTEGERSIVNDANTLLTWFGIKGSETTSPLTEWFALDLEGKRPHHEKFARGFEAYAFEGNAPSLELQSMFQKFRAWLLSVYKELKALRVELTDDVRGVMDRMLASTQAIQEAEAARRLGPLFKTAEDAGMSLDDFRAYHALATDASQAAIEELQARGLRDMKWLEGAKDRKLKELQKLHDSLRREVRAEVRREVMSQPVYRAWQFLTGKGEVDETAQAPDKPKASKELDVINDDLLTAVAKLGGLNKDQAVTVWGIDPKEKPDSGVFGMPVLRANGGLSIDAMAERLLEAGYLLPDEDGRHDARDFEDKFNAALRGESIYSLWHDYKRPDDAAPVQAPPEGIAFGKLDTAELERRYGNAPDAPWRKLQKLRMTSGARGLHPDVIAETVGMGSGDQMVKALLDAEPPQSVIEGMTSQRMLERFGDLGTPEGLQRAVDRAIHNEVRARFLSTEIAALERGMQVRRDTGEVNAKGQRVTVDIMAQVARQQAERIVGGTKVKNLRPSQYTAAETRAAKAAERAMLTGNTEEALAEKRHQLINLQAARAATRAQEEVEKIASYLRRFNDKPKGLDADYYDQIAQLLERFDLAGSTTLKQIAKRKTLAAWVESQREQGLEPDIPPELLDEANRTSYKDMTVDELRGLRDTVRQIEKLGRVKNTLLTAKQQRDFQAVRDLISDSILENAGGRVADTRTPATRTARWFKAVKDFGAAHIKAATWARVFDGGKDGGPVWEYFIRPANEAADMETRMRAEATEKLHAILAPVIKAGRMDGKGQHFPTIGRSMNREQVFAMALNMGNEGNIQRMLDGEGWTVQQIEPVLATLSAADWQAVQAVWDHFESYRPLIGAKERRVYGKEPAWVDPMPLGVRTADGQTVQLRGGYYPVKYDPLANNRAEQHADAEDAKRQMQAAYTSATTRRGFTKSRAEAVKGRPLLYSLAAVYSGTQDVIHDLAFHEWLIDVNKLLRSDKINDAIRETYGPSAVRQLKTWIEDTARGEQGLQAEMDSMLGRLRQGVSVAGLGFNVMSAAIQPIGLTQSVVRVGGKWIGRGVAQYLANPLGKAREVNARSEFMASRARTRFRELNELRNQVEGEHPVRTWTSNAAFYMMTRMQMAVDVPTWLGAYEKAISEGNSDERAGQLADQAVIDAQGGGQMKDLSAIERGGPAQKLFTVFYSFMSTALNVGVAQTMTEKSKAKLVADYLLLYTVPAVLTVALKDALMPGDSGDWDDPEKILRKLLEAQLDNLFGLMVGVRELAGAAKMALGLSEYAQDYQGPAGLRLLGDITGLAEQIGQGELDDSFRKRAVNVLGSAFGLPAAQANRTITGAQALIEGETDNPAALAFGYQQP